MRSIVRITDRFREEHAGFLSQLDALRGRAQNGTPGELVVRGIRELAAPLLRHARAEEGSLFPGLAQDDAAGPIRVLTEEHGHIEDMLGRFALDMSDASVHRLFEALDELLRGHIAREDDVLFPLAERTPGDARLSELEEATAGIRT